MARIGLKLREQIAKNGGGVAGVRAAGEVLREAMKAGKITKEDISLREMAQSLIGDNWSGHLQNYAGRLRESVDAVDSSGFTSITGQLLVDEVKDKYKLATFVGDQLFSVYKNPNGNLGTHIVPYLTDVTSDPDLVNQGQQYPASSFQGQYITYPAPRKYGHICNVTFEAIYADLTGQIIESAGSVGKRVGLWVEKQKLRTVLGLDNPHVWNGTAYNTYVASGGSWVNKLTDFTLTNWTSLQRLELLFSKMLDPVLNEPIEIEGGTLFTVPALRYTAKRIINATAVRDGDITSGAGIQTETGNPLDGGYQLITSKHARRQALTYGSATYTSEAIADTVTVFGDPKKAFKWREVFPLQVVQAPPQNPMEFNQDVVMSVKANVFGVACVHDPRFVILAYNASAT